MAGLLRLLTWREDHALRLARATQCLLKSSVMLRATADANSRQRNSSQSTFQSCECPLSTVARYRIARWHSIIQDTPMPTHEVGQWVQKHPKRAVYCSMIVHSTRRALAGPPECPTMGAARSRCCTAVDAFKNDVLFCSVATNRKLSTCRKVETPLHS